MEQLQAGDAEDRLEYGERTAEDEEDCVWVSVPETAETEDENRVVEEEAYIGLPSCGSTDQEEEEVDEEDMYEEHQLLCEGSHRNICSVLGIMKVITLFVQGWCQIMMPWLV